MKYLFIDEIQNVKGFEEVINSWREEGDISIFITGSNSYLLSGELVTKLSGRYVMTTDTLEQKRNGIRHVNIMNFMKEEKNF